MLSTRLDSVRLFAFFSFSSSSSEQHTAEQSRAAAAVSAQTPSLYLPFSSRRRQESILYSACDFEPRHLFNSIQHRLWQARSSSQHAAHALLTYISRRYHHQALDILSATPSFASAPSLSSAQLHKRNLLGRHLVISTIAQLRSQNLLTTLPAPLPRHSQRNIKARDSRCKQPHHSSHNDGSQHVYTHPALQDYQPNILTPFDALLALNGYP